MSKIGILGSGAVAKALGAGFIKHGYEVMLGSRDTAKLANWQETNSKATLGSFEDAAKFGDIVVLAVKGSAAADVIELAGIANLNGKTVIDTTNPIADAPPENAVVRFYTGPDDSLMERLQAQFPKVNFVKCFNSVGNGDMVDPRFKEKPTMFIAGNNDAAKKTVNDILEQFGWEVADMGKATAARAIEPLCMLWCIPGFLSNNWSHAFKLVME